VPNDGAALGRGDQVRFGESGAVLVMALIGAYSRLVLGSSRRAGSMAALMSVLYASLYFVLGLEDYTLLMGSSLLFAILAVFMLSTRRLDGYALASRTNPAAAG